MNNRYKSIQELPFFNIFFLNKKVSHDLYPAKIYNSNTNSILMNIVLN